MTQHRFQEMLMPKLDELSEDVSNIKSDLAGIAEQRVQKSTKKKGFCEIINIFASSLCILMFFGIANFNQLQSSIQKITETMITRQAPPRETIREDVPGLSPSLRDVLWYAE